MYTSYWNRYLSSIKEAFDFKPNTNKSRNELKKKQAISSVNNVQESKNSLPTEPASDIDPEDEDKIEDYTKILHEDF